MADSKPQSPAPNTPLVPLLLRREEAAKILSIGMTDLRRLMNEDAFELIPTGRGRGIRITHESLLRYIERQRAIAADEIARRRKKYRATRATNKARKNGGQQ